MKNVFCYSWFCSNLGQAGCAASFLRALAGAVLMRESCRRAPVGATSRGALRTESRGLQDPGRFVRLAERRSSPLRVLSFQDHQDALVAGLRGEVGRVFVSLSHPAELQVRALPGVNRQVDLT